MDAKNILRGIWAYVLTGLAMSQTTTTLSEAYTQAYIQHKYLLAPVTFWFNLMPAPYGYVPFLMIIGVMYYHIWQKTGILIPTILLLFYLGMFGGLIAMTGFGAYLFYGVIVMAIVTVFVKALT